MSDGTGSATVEAVLLTPVLVSRSDPLEHCCDVLTALRRAIAGAEWDVALDDLPIPWDARNWRYIAGPDHLEHYHQAMAWEDLVVWSAT